MAAIDSTTNEEEFYSEMSKAQSRLTGLAAIGFLLLRANEDISDYSDSYWEEFYEKCPWVDRHEDWPTDGQLPRDLVIGLAELIFRETGAAWHNVTDADGIIRKEKSVGKLIWMEPAPQAAPEGELEAHGAKAPKLNNYTPDRANAKISVADMWKHLEALEAVADDPAKVRKWAAKIDDELQKCQVA